MLKDQLSKTSGWPFHNDFSGPKRFGTFEKRAPGLDLFPDSTLSRFVNSQLVASCQLGFLIMFLNIKFELFLSHY